MRRWWTPAGADDTNQIVITAQGRSQRLSDVPVAVSAVSGELLEKSGTTDIRELNQVAPSLLVSSTGNEANGSARIRGIGTVGDNPGLESSVAVFVDGVYRSRSGNALSELGPDRPHRNPARPAGHAGRPQLIRRPHQHLHRAARIRFQRLRQFHLRQFRCDPRRSRCERAARRAGRRARRRHLFQARRFLQRPDQQHDGQQPGPLPGPRASPVRAQLGPVVPRRRRLFQQG